ncbi:MAG: acyl-CoA dehydrogenase family protein, partial [Planctomycetota bacterium]
MSDLLETLRERARKLGERVAPVLEGLSEEDAAQRALREVCDDVGGGPLTAWCVPKRDGGADTGGLASDDKVSVRALCELRDELAWHSGLLEFVLVMQGLGSYPIALGGSEELRREVLPDVIQGKRVAAFALTEPDAGSSLGDISTRATRDADGSWRLKGQKTFISNAGIAALYTVLARTSGEPGDGSENALSMFFVPANSAGIEVRPFEVMAPHPIGEVHFHDVKVSKGHLLGEEGEGLGLALGTLNRFRTSVAAASNGFSRRALDESKTRLQGRSQFGRPLSSFQALRFDLAEMDCRLRAAQLL